MSSRNPWELMLETSRRPNGGMSDNRVFKAPPKQKRLHLLSTELRDQTIMKSAAPGTAHTLKSDSTVWSAGRPSMGSTDLCGWCGYERMGPETWGTWWLAVARPVIHLLEMASQVSFDKNDSLTFLGTTGKSLLPPFWAAKNISGKEWRFQLS